jgi:thioredoxin-like negative regulator of GroEL
MLARTLEDVVTETSIEVIDIDENSALAAKFGIRGVPTLVMVEDDVETKRLVGMKSQKELEEWLND